MKRVDGKTKHSVVSNLGLGLKPGGFVEYGLWALAGVLMAMAWVGSTITKDHS